MKRIKAFIESTVDELNEAGLSESSDKTATVADAIMKNDDDALVISYRESTEGGEVATKILLSGDTVTVMRSGALESEFVFREGESHISLYKIAPYSFDAEIRTRRIRGSITEDGGEMTLIYDMTVGGAAKRVRMRIRVDV